MLEYRCAMCKRGFYTVDEKQPICCPFCLNGAILRITGYRAKGDSE